MLAAASDRTVGWEIVVIGGGATGLGVAVDAAARGYRTLLVEKGDFANATSSRSTKLIHGGVRYLQQGNIKLVREALRERGLLMKNAAHLVHPLQFVIPSATRWEGLFYSTGLKIYDAMSGRYGIGRTKHLSRQKTEELLPTVRRELFIGGTAYTDGQFDDARLAITLARTAADLGATVLNYGTVTSLQKEGGRICGVMTRDVESGREMEIKARVVINATGIFADEVRRLDDPSSATSLSPSQGAHVVLPKSFFPGDSALMIPKTDDGRVLFAIPWHDRVLVGTTDTPVEKIEPAPRPLSSELEFLLTHAGRYLSQVPHRSDVLCTFAGLRPLAAAPTSRQSALIPRDHHLSVSESGLITITGGKWTTYRRMARDTVDRAAAVGNLSGKPCRTEDLRLHGCPEATDSPGMPSVYGSDTAALKELGQSEADALLHPRLPYSAAEIIWAVRFEMARTLEDVLARRTRALFLDVRASLEIAPRVAALMAQELRRDTGWQKEQVRQFETIARGYLPA